ncbi:MAG: LCP family protein [Erysipelotrichaceae bacterium]
MKRPSINTLRKIDIIFLLVYIITSIVCCVKINKLQMLPTLWQVLLIIILLLIFGIIFITINLTKKTRYVIIRCGIELILSILLISVSVLSNTLDTSISESLSLPTSIKQNISILVRTDSDIKTTKDLDKKNVGVQNGMDEANAKYVLEQLKKDNSIPVQIEYIDYAALAINLVNKDIDALVVGDAYLTSLYENVPNLKESTKVLKSYQREIKNEHASTSNVDITKDVFTVYISGMDEVGDPTQNLRSDVNILLIVNPKIKHIEMISFPRDAYIPNIATNNLNDKLTHTGIYGVETTIKSMENVLDIPIDFYAKVSFTSLIEIVDTLGGIDVDVPISFCEQDEYRSYINELCINKGQQKLSGSQALAFSRHRHSYEDQDLGRNRAQQLVMKAIIKKAVSIDGIKAANDLLAIVSKTVMSNIPDKQLRSFVSQQLNNPSSWTMESTAINQGVYEMYNTASMGANLPLSCYVFKRSELQRVIDSYYAAKKDINLSNFNFNLEELNKDRVMLKEHEEMIFTDEEVNSFEKITTNNEVVNE